MPLLWIVCALAMVTVAGALLLQARRIKARHLRFFRAPAVEAAPDGTRLVDAARALYHGTRFADGTALLAPAWKEPCVCDLWATEEALFVQREGPGALLVIALRSIEDAALHRAFAPLAGRLRPSCRCAAAQRRWKRCGARFTCAKATWRRSLRRF